MSAAIRNYVHAVYGLDAVVQRTADDDWTRPSPCEQWTALDVVVHNAWAFDIVSGMAQGRPASVPSGSTSAAIPAPSDDGYMFHPDVWAIRARLADEYAGNPLRCWNRDRDGLMEALDLPGAAEMVTRSPWGETTVDDWLAFAVWDPLVHTWDLAEAVGQRAMVDPSLCELALEAARAFDARMNLRRTGGAAPELEPSGLDGLSRLLAFAGRDVGWRAARGIS